MALLCLAAAGIAAEGKALPIALGGKEGWSRATERLGVAEGDGRFGWKRMELSSDARSADDGTDLLVNFERRPFSDDTGGYEIINDGMSLSSASMMGKGAGLARGSGGIRARGKPGSVFGTEGPTGSFIVEFWLSPSTAENGESVFNWRSSRDVDDKIIYQMASCSFTGNHLLWELTNFFDGFKGEVVSLEGVKNITPGVWSHHALIFDEVSGALEYRVDGILEDIAFATSTRREGGAVCPAWLGVPAEIEICPSYTGLVDDARIERGTDGAGRALAAEGARPLSRSKYSTKAGRFATEPLMAAAGARLDSIDAVYDEPAQTEARFFVRAGDNFYGWTDSFPEWKRVASGEKIDGVSGLFFQVAVELMSDGLGDKTPSVTSLVLNCVAPEKPLPPFNVRAEAGDGSVSLSWSRSADETAGDYFVYYGTRPGEYLGRAAAEGASPVRCGQKNSMTLTGLENGTIYYFAVAACSSLDPRINGELSKETSARPGRRQ